MCEIANYSFSGSTVSYAHITYFGANLGEGNVAASGSFLLDESDVTGSDEVTEEVADGILSR